MPSTPHYLLTRPSLMRASDALATALTRYAIPLIVLATTNSASLTGVAFLLEWAPCLAAFTIGGPLVDRYRADTVFKTANAARAAATSAAAVLLTLLPADGTAATTVVLALGATTGLLAQGSFVAAETLGAGISRQAGEHAHRVQGVQVSIDQGALLLGPLLVGVLLVGGAAWPLLALVAVLSIAAAASTIPPSLHATSPTGSVLKQLRTGWNTLRRGPALTWLVIGLMASNLAVGVAQASVPITLVQDYAANSLTVGLVWSGAGVLALGAVTLSLRAIDRHGLWPVGATAAATASTACFAAALAPRLAPYIAAIALLMAGEGALTVVLRTLRARLIPPAVFGSTLSVTIVLIALPMPTAGALVALLPAPALPALLLGCAAAQALTMALAFRGLWRHRDSYKATPEAEDRAFQRDNYAPVPAA
ncbi:MFS transporter [Streptomyces sp. NBC_00470]|uniref:MFS transporter n=1 Tax=Streptomyces sp. NBC_00470 TaxID=2975753 RepID=UPI002F918FFC